MKEHEHERDPDVLANLQHELSDLRGWIDRAVVLAYAVLAGLAVVGFTLLSEWAFEHFQRGYAAAPWLVLVWTPALTAAIVWMTRRWVPGAAGSGIPQVMAALAPGLPPAARGRLVSLRLSVGKTLLGALGLLAGLSLGREGPSVQVAAGVMHNARHWLRRGQGLNEHALLVAGGAAGIAAAFNAPLAGVVFAIEELSRKLDARNSGLIIAAIVLAGLMGVSAFGNYTYFGAIRVPGLDASALLPGLLVAVSCGVAGGVFARLLIASLTGSPDRISRWRQRRPVAFAALGGLAVAVIGLASGGATFGAGAQEVRRMLAGESDVMQLYALLKFVATWITTWCGVPGGIFAPALSIGAGIGHDIAQLTAGSASSALTPVLIAMGMAGFLAAVTQAPLTAFIIVMEMIDGRALVLTLMASAMVASLVSRLISRPLYAVLAHHMLRGAVATAEPGAPGAQPPASTPSAPAVAAPAPAASTSGPTTADTAPR
ncbi:MAG: chloride channel protein [Pseudomonadota bacterium]